MVGYDFKWLWRGSLKPVTYLGSDVKKRALLKFELSSARGVCLKDLFIYSLPCAKMFFTEMSALVLF